MPSFNVQINCLVHVFINNMEQVGTGVYIHRGVVTRATEPNLAPDADPLAPEDSKSNSKQLKLKI